MIQIPAERFLIPKKVQTLILLIPAGDLKGSNVRCALFLLKKKRSVRRAHQTIRAGDHIKSVVSLLLPGVMYHH